MTQKPLHIPRIIGHRGAKAYAPENTLPSIHTAADMGIEWVELDVKLTKDGEAIIFHDDNLRRCTGLDANVADTDFKAIMELDAGSWFGDTFIGEKIPTLEQALETILDRGLGLNLEIKPCPGREIETAEIALDIATRIWPDDQQPPLISSFQNVSLETARDMIDFWPRGFLIDDYNEQWADMVKYLDAKTIHVNGNTVTEDQMHQYLTAHLPILAYTINDAYRADILQSWGVHGFFSDMPDVIRDEIETLH